MLEFIRKTVPQSRENRGPVSNTPNVPIISKETLRGLETVFYGTIPSSDGIFEIQQAALEPGRYNPSTKVCVLTPVSRLPLRTVFQVGHGGGRAYGGGTSRESLRRAKRKAKASGLKQTSVSG